MTHPSREWSEAKVRVALFTDTLADVNGPARFIQNVAAQARRRGLPLTILTSTRKPCPAEPNIINVPPRATLPLPRYPELALALPPLRRLLHHVRRLDPDVVHVSTPGPVGLLGVWAARALRRPLLGVYHTDFPAYVERLFRSPRLAGAARLAMRAFYSRFAGVFARSGEYARALERLGLPSDRILPLRPGIDTRLFSPLRREPAVWNTIPGARPDAVKVLYVGRVSVEKNLPLLVEVWRGVRAAAEAQLVVVGGGPYLDAMRKALEAHDAVFVGYRFGEELARLYASSDLFVFPSATDTLGQVVMEAQCSGLATLVSDRGGPREMVLDGSTGLVLPADDPRAWIEAIVALVRDEPRRRAMGHAAARHMRDYSIERSFDDWWSAHQHAARQADSGHTTRFP